MATPRTFGDDSKSPTDAPRADGNGTTISSRSARQRCLEHLKQGRKSAAQHLRSLKRRVKSGSSKQPRTTHLDQNHFSSSTTADPLAYYAYTQAGEDNNAPFRNNASEPDIPRPITPEGFQFDKLDAGVLGGVCDALHDSSTNAVTTKS
ncbi:hypothetical protein F4801DRAFT_580137 [Xylaria longipes]|nr:hypothetical protein F4801DRAFT_580137 [Xylaria longipes]